MSVPVGNKEGSMRSVFVVLLIVAMARLAQAGSVTFDFGNPITLTRADDGEVAPGHPQVHAVGPAQEPPIAALTIEQYLRASLTNTVREQVQQGSQDEAAQFCVAYKALGANAQNQITAAGGGNSPCP
jgi:hypothetical protein